MPDTTTAAFYAGRLNELPKPGTVRFHAIAGHTDVTDDGEGNLIAPDGCKVGGICYGNGRYWVRMSGETQPPADRIPVNPETGNHFFEVPAEGWGTGWEATPGFVQHGRCSFDVSTGTISFINDDGNYRKIALDMGNAEDIFERFDIAKRLAQELVDQIRSENVPMGTDARADAIRCLEIFLNPADNASPITEAMIDRVMADYPDACPVCTYDGLWPWMPGDSDKRREQDIRGRIRELLKLALSELPASRVVRPGSAEGH